jgi:hypothetical protein
MLRGRTMYDTMIECNVTKNKYIFSGKEFLRKPNKEMPVILFPNYSYPD